MLIRRCLGEKRLGFIKGKIEWDRKECEVLEEGRGVRRTVIRGSGLEKRCGIEER
jgi:hypothetical protein